MRSTDVVIVGGSLAGASCALELQGLGIEALALERATLPRKKVCGAFLSPGAVGRLCALGVLDGLRQLGTQPVEGVRLSVPPDVIDIPLTRPGLGCSRDVLDLTLARSARVREGHSVESVRTRAPARGFDVDVRGPGGELETYRARIVVDAAGRFSRLTPSSGGSGYGVRFSGTRELGTLMEFGFYDWGYGGSVGVGGGGSNSCFLVPRSEVRRFDMYPDRQVTGPIVYRREPGPYLAIGDAAGMVDPFSGEGMHHALDSGRIAAAAIARGLEYGWSYRTICGFAREEHAARWGRRRLAGAVARKLASGTLWPRLARIPGAASLLLRAWWEDSDRVS